MSKSKVEKYIEKVERDFVLSYEAETESLLKQKEAEFALELSKIKTKALEKIEKEKSETLSTTKQALDFESASKGEALKSLMIEEIYQEGLAKIKTLKGPALFDFVYRLIAKEKLSGHHRLLVKKANFEKYNQALSDKSNADLLNQKFKDVSFTLEVYDDAVEEGFIIEDEKFDLYFDFKDLLSKHKDTHAFEIYQRLFGGK
ncbi:MAG: hypothetical protein GX807_00880 [Erysipelotrichia bacterium]|nr:hypothetical protein [Erysipelotrichia bacterium]